MSNPPKSLARSASNSQTLLRNGKVLIVAGSENDPNKHLQRSSKAAVWDLAAHTITVQQMLWDVFCNGGIFFADGRCMVVGGTVEYDPFYGDPRITVFDPLTNKFNQLQSMAHGRWYATAITLGDGRVLAFSGYSETGATNQTVEIYKVASGWSPLTTQVGLRPCTLGYMSCRTALFSIREVHRIRESSIRLVQ